MRLVLMSDTHLPGRAGDLPPQLWAAVDAADVVVHAGDWVSLTFLSRLEGRLAGRGARLIGVYGNNDGDDVRARLPEVARAQLAGVRLAVVHETGQATGREKRMAQEFHDADVVVFGHSHIPWDTFAGPHGPRLLNPGSPTDRRRQPTCTYLTAGCEPGGADRGILSDVRLHHVAT
jgi:hypothetical protein